MSRKDYQAIADVIKASSGDVPTLTAVAKGIADVFAADNPRFDRERFYDACDLAVAA